MREEHAPGGVEATEWFLTTSEEAESSGGACETAGYYIQRWKTGRFHYALKSGRAIERLRERSMEKMKVLILMCSVIAVFIMSLTYMARIHPRLPRAALFEDEEWKTLYRAANRTKKAPHRPYAIKQAADYIGWLGWPKRAPGDGPPGVKTVWTGLQKFYTLLVYREFFNFMGQV
ncbi:MAG: hypothetical protein LBH85_02230 [Treponema sp.]|nr:hypothetical protein [Treponema sp.]